MNTSNDESYLCFDREHLDQLYDALHHRRYVYPDPLIFLYDYPDCKDREIVGLIAASLAYGRVEQILKSVKKVLQTMGEHPSDFLRIGSIRVFEKKLHGFVHRFARDEHLVGLFLAMKKVVQQYGSLQGCFLRHYNPNETTTQPALTGFVRELVDASGGKLGHLVPDPEKGSACKRLHLFLRWMVRNDRVDPGGWDGVSAAQLIMPLDVHIFRICRDAGWVHRRQPSMTAAFEITRRFQEINPADPVRYDFALSRLGIRKDMNIPRIVPPGLLRTRG